MRRTVTPELLDSPDCPPDDARASLRDLSRINRWFGGVSTTRALIERVAAKTSRHHFSLLEVAAGFGDAPLLAAQQLSRDGITIDITLLDSKGSHLPSGNRSVIADALSLPFADRAFDLVHSNLFAHHLEPCELARFVRESLRVCRCAVLINDLIRDPLHLALAYAGFPLLRSYVSRADGPASVRRAYTPDELQRIVSSCGAAKVDVSRHFLFRMGIIVWK
jgi:ubiquinone/menaquinone biosynthesis C-methylase UbiE